MEKMIKIARILPKKTETVAGLGIGFTLLFGMTGWIAPMYLAIAIGLSALLVQTLRSKS